MTLYEEAVKQMQEVEHVFGFCPMNVEQKSDDWHVMKMGVLSASNADKIVAKAGTQGRQTYMASLISQVCTCTLPDELKFKQIEHGNLYEPVARDALSVELGFVEIKEIPFLYSDSKMRVGISPDGIFDRTVCEIKAPFNGENFFNFACFDSNKKSWRWQSQFQIHAAKADRHIFCQYEPRAVLCNNLHYIETEKSEADQKTLDDAIPQFIYEMDQALKRLGVEFGEHWAHLKKQRGNQ